MGKELISEDSIQRLFNPRHIAIIGASDTVGRIGHIIYKTLLSSSAILYPVNPKQERVGTHQALNSPAELPDNIDLAMITINATAAVEAAEACAFKGCANIVIVAGGFGEIGEEGKALEARLRALPEKYNCRILGPNSLGVFVPSSNLDTIFVEHGDQALSEGGGVAFITQSGSVGVESLGLASNSGFGMRAFVGIGNKVDMSEADFLSWFGDDPATDCLALYVESIERGRSFLEDAREVARNKPVVLLKAGRTQAGASAVSSHTGRLAGSDNVVSGALRQYGVQRAMDDEELCDASKVLSMVKPAKGNRVAVLTPAGGFAVMCSDYIDSPDKRASLCMAEISEKTQKRIKKNTFPFASCHNPVDLTAGATDEMFIEALKALLDDDGVDIIICVAFFAPPTISENLLPAMSALIREAPKPVLVFTQYGPFTDDYLKHFYREGVAGYPSINRVVRAARFLVERHRLLRDLESGALDLDDNSESLEPLVESKNMSDMKELFIQWCNKLRIKNKADEWETKELFRSVGLPVPAQYLFKQNVKNEDIESLSFLPAGLEAPFAVKLCSPNVLHKSDVGGVKLSVGHDDLATVLKDMRVKFPGENFLIYHMEDIRGIEFILGALNDPSFGPAVMVGAGGVMTELYKDVSFCLAPCTALDAEHILSELTIAPILEGFRGSNMDRESLKDIIVKFSALAWAAAQEGAQLDINPIVWNGEAWTVLDAKCVFI